MDQQNQQWSNFAALQQRMHSGYDQMLHTDPLHGYGMTGYGAAATSPASAAKWLSAGSTHLLGQQPVMVPQHPGIMQQAYPTQQMLTMAGNLSAAQHNASMHPHGNGLLSSNQSRISSGSNMNPQAPQFKPGTGQDVRMGSNRPQAGQQQHDRHERQQHQQHQQQHQHPDNMGHMHATSSSQPSPAPLDHRMSGHELMVQYSDSLAARQQLDQQVLDFLRMHVDQQHQVEQNQHDKVSGLLQQVDAEQAHSKALDQQLSQTKANLKEQQDKLATSERTVRELRTSVEDLSFQLKNATQAVEGAAKREGEERERADNTQQQLDSERERANEVAGQVAGLQGEVEQLKAQILAVEERARHFEQSFYFADKFIKDHAPFNRHPGLPPPDMAHDPTQLVPPGFPPPAAPAPVLLAQPQPEQHDPNKPLEEHQLLALFLDLLPDDPTKAIQCSPYFEAGVDARLAPLVWDSHYQPRWGTVADFLASFDNVFGRTSRDGFYRLMSQEQAVAQGLLRPPVPPSVPPLMPSGMPPLPGPFWGQGPPAAPGMLPPHPSAPPLGGMLPPHALTSWVPPLPPGFGPPGAAVGPAGGPLHGPGIVNPPVQEGGDSAPSASTGEGVLPAAAAPTGLLAVPGPTPGFGSFLAGPALDAYTSGGGPPAGTQFKGIAQTPSGAQRGTPGAGEQGLPVGQQQTGPVGQRQGKGGPGRQNRQGAPAPPPAAQLRQLEEAAQTPKPAPAAQAAGAGGGQHSQGPRNRSRQQLYGPRGAGGSAGGSEEAHAVGAVRGQGQQGAAGGHGGQRGPGAGLGLKQGPGGQAAPQQQQQQQGRQNLGAQAVSKGPQQEQQQQQQSGAPRRGPQQQGYPRQAAQQGVGQARA